MADVCPGCLSPLTKEKDMGGLTFLCTNCGQRAIDISSLRDSLVAPHWKEVLERRRKMKASGGKGCKKIGCSLQAFDYQTSEGKDIEVDICFHCNQVWFDHHETDAVEKSEKVVIDTELPTSLKLEIGKIKTRDGQVIPRHRSFSFHWSDLSVTWVHRSFELYGARAFLGLLGVPIENHNRLRGMPVWTYSLLLFVFLASVTAFYAGMPAYKAWAFSSEFPLKNYGLNSLSAFFLHADWGHLLGNLYMLYVFGDNVEDHLRWKYPVMLASGTVLGSVCHMLVTPRPELLLVGASTGISSVVAYYALSFPGTRFSVLLGWLFWVRFPVMFYVLFWVLLQFIGVFRTTPEMSGVSFGGHLGGALVGLLFWLWPKLTRS